MEAAGKNRSQFHVLVVEDDDEVRCLLEREIEEQGHPVTAVDDAEKALDQLAERSYAIVITDIRMPGMDGVELTRRVKQGWPETEVIIITGFASIDSASRAVRLGASDYLTKPFGDIDRIAASIDRALDKILARTATRLQITSLEAQRESLRRLLDSIPLGVILIDGQGRVQLSNQGAGAILALADGLNVAEDGRLRGSHAEVTVRLRQLISGAVGAGGEGRPRQGGATTLPRPSGKAPLSVLVTPLVEAGEAATAVFVSDPEQRVETAEALLCRLYGLTPTEARLAAILMQGRSIDDAGVELGVSTNTARTHLKRIFAKTHTSHQGDLISLLLSGPAMLQPPSGQERG